MQRKLIILDDEFQKTEIYKDIGDYKNMTLLALSKKIPHWVIIWKKSNTTIDLARRQHLKNYCRDCDADVMFLIYKSYQSNHWGHYPILTNSKDDFWDFYREQFKKLINAAFHHLNDTKIANEKVKCECGGYYSSINKAKHFKTKKHLKYQSV